MRLDVERAVARLASSQFGAIARSQALDLGMSEKAIRIKVATGCWQIVDRGVYLISGSPRSRQRDVMVCVLACGCSAVASGRTAARLHGLSTEWPDVVEVLVDATNRPRSKAGRRVRRTRDLPRSDVTKVAGIAATSVPRTLLDLARLFSHVELEAALDRALVSGRTSIGAMRRYLEASGRTRNITRLTRLLDDREFGVPESELERTFERLVKRYRLRMPIRQKRVRRFRVDYAYVELDIVIEVDGSATRSTKAELQRDRRRQNEISLDKLLILRFTWDDVTKDADYVVATIMRALDGAGGGS